MSTARPAIGGSSLFDRASAAEPCARTCPSTGPSLANVAMQSAAHVCGAINRPLGRASALTLEWSVPVADLTSLSQTPASAVEGLVDAFRAVATIRSVWPCAIGAGRRTHMPPAAIADDIERSRVAWQTVFPTAQLVGRRGK